MADEALHWADLIAKKIIAEKGDKESYTLASGITPSGTIHIGKFREVITTEMVSRALARMGKKTRFIYSWDDYDTFRKVPADMPEQEMLKSLLYRPIVDIPDVYGTEDSYARHNEVTLENIAPALGIANIEFVYQSKIYRSGAYNDLIVKAMDSEDKIRRVLQEYKTREIDADWHPIETYCSECNRDRVSFKNYDPKNKTIDYECKLCGHKETLNLRESKRLKLPWRVDWPMRWAYENVDFEPGGTDHSSAGGSFDTAKGIVGEIFGGSAPVYAKYAFVLPKGEKKKMSSSVGNGFSVASVLEVYTPEMARWFFASYKPDATFNLAFDIDVLKNYENFDRMEREVYGQGDANDDKRAALRRIYEMSQINFDGKIPDVMPFQPGFRHLCNNLQVNELDIAKTRAMYADQIKNDVDERRYRERAERAVFWIENYAPEDFQFFVNKERRSDIPMTDAEKAFVAGLRAVLETEIDERGLQDKIGALIESNGLDSIKAYRLLYQLLVGRDKGPKLANFIMTIGREKVLALL
ncbi:MAG: lysine--tRNA ligase [Rickettsiales bacterium]|jgi:lysyl-tRNA synthetase class 1|nr:lysine--tRNA ligase [Rickettsiales bacterium]